LVRLPFFSKPLLPSVITCTNFLLYLFALPVLLLMMAFDGLPLTRALLALPIVWAVQWILTLGVTVLIAALGILIRDVQHLMGVIMLLWFYLTPIFYDLSRLPATTARWFVLNPMTAIVSAHRAITLRGEFPDWGSLAAVALAGTAVLVLSLRIFRTLEDAFIEQT
jgi:ABC-type polysaccharide/polyol phosphate export permease